MRSFEAFRRLLGDRGLTYLFNEDTETYDIYHGWWGRRDLPPDRYFLVSVSAQMARRDIEGSRDTILTALELEAMFGS